MKTGFQDLTLKWLNAVKQCPYLLQLRPTYMDEKCPAIDDDRPCKLHSLIT